jgi:hypothetical protein
MEDVTRWWQFLWSLFFFFLVFVLGRPNGSQAAKMPRGDEKKKSFQKALIQITWVRSVVTSSRVLWAGLLCL